MSLSVLIAAAGLAVSPLSPASATGGSSSSSPNFVCTANTVYTIDSTGSRIRKLNPTTGSFSDNGSFQGSGSHDDDEGSDAINALAIPGGGGRYAYAFNRSQNQILRFDASTNKVTSWSAPSNSSASSVIAGAINPANGIYYYASGGTPWKLFAFNTNTSTSIGQVGTIAGLAGNGDMAFDAVGNLYVVSNSGSSGAGTLARINGPLPTTSGSTAFSSTTLATLPGDSGQYASMAFDGSGELIIGTTAGKVLRVNPTNGSTIGTKTISLSMADMASCANPSTALARVNLPDGRFAPGDQFKTTVTGGGITTGNTGTTAGTDTGLQTDPAEVAGPVVVLPGGTYTITQTGASGANLANYATTWKCIVESSGATLASGSGSSGTFTVPSASGSSVVCTFTNTPVRPAIEIDKTGSAIQDLDGNGPDAGDKITYSFKVTNTGNVPLNPVTVTDTKVGTVTCPSGPLAPGASVNCTPKDYTITQAEVTAGKVDNTATAQGTPPSGPPVTHQDSVSTPVPSLPGIELDKTAGALNDNDSNGPDAGDTITYSFKVTNTGNVPLNPVTVTDPKVGPVVCPSGALAPGASVDCTQKTYTVTQADVNAGKVDNTATAKGKAPNDVEVTDNDSTTTPLGSGPAIKLVKSGSAINDVNGNGNDAGDTITYSFKVTNTGNVTLSNIVVSDPKVGPVTCPNDPLAPGASVDCTPRLYTITQADVNAGEFDNTATAEGTAPDGEVVEDDDQHHVDLPATPSIAIDKVAGSLVDVDGNGPDAGDTITFSFTVYNTGALALTHISVSDPKAGPVTCPETELAPDESMTCTDVVYTVTPADVAAGKVDNTATVTGTPPSGPPVEDDDSTTTTITSTTTNIKVVKDVDNANPRVGDTITYTVTVTNTGTASAQNVVITDHLPGGVTFVSAENPCTRSGSTVTCAIGTLPAGGSASVDIKVKVDALPAVNTEHQHWFDVQKTEVHVDLESGEEKTASVTCMPGYVLTDGSGRIDHVDQGTGTFEDVYMTENRAVGLDTWRTTFVNEAGGRAQAKIFAVCLKQDSETVSGHGHSPVVGALVTETHPLPQGQTEVTLTCAPGHTPVQPGYQLDGFAVVLTTYPDGDNGWTWVVDNGDATQGTFTMRCLDDLVSQANGHTHGFKFSEIRQTGTVPAGQSKEFTLTCAGDAKGIVAGFDMDPGLVNQGNDPRPIIRVFKFYNPTDGPLDVRMFLLCLGNRTGGGADGGGNITNTASATTTTPETTTADNSDDAKITVNTSPPASIVSKTVTMTSKAVMAPVQCKKGKSSCTGVATLVSLKGGTVLAKASFKVKAGKKAMLKLKKTKAGKKALRKLKKAKLKVGSKSRTVKIRR